MEAIPIVTTIQVSLLPLFLILLDDEDEEKHSKSTKSSKPNTFPHRRGSATSVFIKKR